MNANQFIVSVLVANHFGVLTRIAGLFSKRGFNIDSLTVGVTEDPDFSRMTIVSTGDEYVKDQIVKQLEKLVDVRVVQLMDPDNTVPRELLIIKLDVAPGNRHEVMEAVQIFRAKVIDLAQQTVTVEITGNRQKLEAFVEYLRPYNIVEICRTGVTAIGRAGYCLKEQTP
ncbi:MAG: acetolactate synthase small subunit [Acetanaerobacterium sp.]